MNRLFHRFWIAIALCIFIGMSSLHTVKANDFCLPERVPEITQTPDMGYVFGRPMTQEEIDFQKSLESKTFPDLSDEEDVYVFSEDTNRAAKILFGEDWAKTGTEDVIPAQYDLRTLGYMWYVYSSSVKFLEDSTTTIPYDIKFFKNPNTKVSLDLSENFKEIGNAVVEDIKEIPSDLAGKILDVVPCSGIVNYVIGLTEGIDDALRMGIEITPDERVDASVRVWSSGTRSGLTYHIVPESDATVIEYDSETDSYTITGGKAKIYADASVEGTFDINIQGQDENGQLRQDDLNVVRVNAKDSSDVTFDETTKVATVTEGVSVSEAYLKLLEKLNISFVNAFGEEVEAGDTVETGFRMLDMDKDNETMYLFVVGSGEEEGFKIGRDTNGFAHTAETSISKYAGFDERASYRLDDEYLDLLLKYSEN